MNVGPSSSATKLNVKLVSFACVGTFLFVALITGFCIVARHRKLRHSCEAHTEAQPLPVKKDRRMHIDLHAIHGEETAVSPTTPLPLYVDYGRRSSSEWPLTPPGLVPPPPVQLPPSYHGEPYPS